MPNIDFSRLPELTNKAFYPLYFDRSRYNILRGGAGSGKSEFIYGKVVWTSLQFPGRNWLALRKYAVTVRDSIWAGIVKKINDWGLADLFDCSVSTFRIINKVNGNEIIFKGLDDEQKLKSITCKKGVITDVLMEEITEFTRDDLLQVNLRLRGKGYQFQINGAFNPVSDRHWIKGFFWDNPPDNCRTHISTYKDNRFLDDEYVKQLLSYKSISENYYNVYCLADWGSIGDIIFSNYVVEEFDIKDEDVRYPLYGMDFGYQHKMAISKCSLVWPDLYIYDELAVRHKTNGQVIESVKQNGFIKPGDRVLADCASPNNIKEWQNAGYNVQPCKKGKDSVLYSINYLLGLKIHVHKKKCPFLIQELAGYAWKKDKAGNILDQPEGCGIGDDCIDSVRYAIEEFWNKKTLVPAAKTAIW